MAFHVSANEGVLGRLRSGKMLEFQKRVPCGWSIQCCDGCCDAPSSNLGTETSSFAEEAEDRSNSCSYDRFLVSFIFT